MKKSQKQTVRDILVRKGKINNLQAIMELHILRLSDIILHLRREGMEIGGDFMVKGEKQTKIYQYYLIK